MKSLPLSQGMEALVDDEDYERASAFKWTLYLRGRQRYAQRSVRKPDGTKTSLALHTFLTGWPRTDHINGDGLDNRRANLRPATALENMRNRRPTAGTLAGYKGVSPSRERFRARIRLDGRLVHLGMYDDAADAARAYDAAAVRLFGEFANLNFTVAPAERGESVAA